MKRRTCSLSREAGEGWGGGKSNTIIATHCIESDLRLLYSDRDFDPFVQRLGLRSAIE
jgi:predicted nucleic acid-binding protein